VDERCNSPSVNSSTDLPRSKRDEQRRPSRDPTALSTFHPVGFDHRNHHTMVVDASRPMPWATNRRMPGAIRTRRLAILRPRRWALLAHYLPVEHLLGFSTRNIAERLNKEHVCVIRDNTLDVCLNGHDVSNFSLTPVSFRRSITEPGFDPGGTDDEGTLGARDDH
jgi:hypothetical protein